MAIAWALIAFPPHAQPLRAQEIRRPGEAQRPADEVGPPLYVYDDAAPAFAPGGWMPDGNIQLSQSLLCQDQPHSGRCCYRAKYTLSPERPWMAVAFLPGGKFQPVREVDVAKALGARPGEPVALRFWARSPNGATVQFKAAGVDAGWIQLQPEWHTYTIDLAGRDLSGVRSVLTWVIDRGHNRSQERAQFDLDDIYFTRLAEPQNLNANRGDLKANRARFYAKLATLRWVDYTPSTFDPEAEGPVKKEDIAADLKAMVASGFAAGKTGICTYSCTPASGLDMVPAVARELGFGGVILGIWSINDADERKAAGRLAQDGLIDAVCVGNEGLDVRYSWEKLGRAMRELRGLTGLPTSTSEQIEDYGSKELTDPQEVDWVYPNIHPVFHSEVDPRRAAEWAHWMAGKLAGHTKLPILVHETGWPTQGLRHHSPEQQSAFWKNLLDKDVKKEYQFALFEAFDQRWKHERFRGADIGTSWGLFDAERRPKPVVDVLRRQSERARK